MTNGSACDPIQIQPSVVNILKIRPQKLNYTKTQIKLVTTDLERPKQRLFWRYWMIRNRHRTRHLLAVLIQLWGYRFWDDNCWSPCWCGVLCWCHGGSHCRCSWVSRHRRRNNPSVIHYWRENCREGWSFVQLLQSCSSDVIRHYVRLSHKLQYKIYTGCSRKKLHKVYHVINVEPFVLELQCLHQNAQQRLLFLPTDKNICL